MSKRKTKKKGFGVYSQYVSSPGAINYIESSVKEEQENDTLAFLNQIAAKIKNKNSEPASKAEATSESAKQESKSVKLVDFKVFKSVKDLNAQRLHNLSASSSPQKITSLKLRSKADKAKETEEIIYKKIVVRFQELGSDEEESFIKLIPHSQTESELLSDLEDNQE